MSDPAADPPDAVDAMLAAWRACLPDLDPGALALVGRVILLAGRLEKRVEAALSAHKLTLGQFDILATLRRDPANTLSPGRLLESVMLSSGGMTSRLDKLAEQGLITRTTDPTDRRGVVVALTPAGRTLIDAATATRFAEAREALPAMTAAERAVVTGVLRRWMRTV